MTVSLSLLINSVSIHTHAMFTSQFKKRIAKDKLAGFVIRDSRAICGACCGGEPAPSPARSRAAGSANTAKRGV